MNDIENKALKDMTEQSEPSWTIERKPRSKKLSRPAYFAAIAAIVASGFAMIFIASVIMSDTMPASSIPTESMSIALVASIAGAIAAIVVQLIGAKNMNPAMCFVGFYILSIALGALTAMVLPMYDIGTITAAAGGTVVLTIIFGIAGFAFPDFFAKIHGMLLTALVGCIIVELIFLIFGIEQGITDWIVLLIFCGFIGFDFYKATHDDPTLINVAMYSTEIYLDILNVLLRVLSIIAKAKE